MSESREREMGAQVASGGGMLTLGLEVYFLKIKSMDGPAHACSS